METGDLFPDRIGRPATVPWRRGGGAATAEVAEGAEAAATYPTRATAALAG